MTESDPVQVPCNHCGTKYEIASGDLGKMATCDHCGKQFKLRTLDHLKLPPRKKIVVSAKTEKVARPSATTATPAPGGPQPQEVHIVFTFGDVLQFSFYFFLANLIIALPIWLLFIVGLE